MYFFLKTVFFRNFRDVSTKFPKNFEKSGQKFSDFEKMPENFRGAFSAVKTPIFQFCASPPLGRWKSHWWGKPPKNIPDSNLTEFCETKCFLRPNYTYSGSRVSEKIFNPYQTFYSNPITHFWKFSEARVLFLPTFYLKKLFKTLQDFNRVSRHFSKVTNSYSFQSKWYEIDRSETIFFYSRLRFKFALAPPPPSSEKFALEPSPLVRFFGVLMRFQY